MIWFCFFQEKIIALGLFSVIPFYLSCNTISNGRLGINGKICFQREGKKNVFLLFLPACVVLFQDSLLHLIFSVGVGVPIDKRNFSVLKEMMLLSWQYEFKIGKWCEGCSTGSRGCTHRWTEVRRKPVLHQSSHRDSLQPALTGADRGVAVVLLWFLSQCLVGSLLALKRIMNLN